MCDGGGAMWVGVCVCGDDGMCVHVVCGVCGVQCDLCGVNVCVWFMHELCVHVCSVCMWCVWW